MGSLGCTHLLNYMGFVPALSIAPAICMIGVSIVKVKLGKGGPTGLPIHGPPAPVPQIAMTVSGVIVLNAVYQCYAGTMRVGQSQSSENGSSQHDLAIYWTVSALIFGVPNVLSQYHLR